MMDAATARLILDVGSDADEEEIQAAFQRETKNEHPDVSDDDEATERFKRVEKARETLLNDDSSSGSGSSSTNRSKSTSSQSQNTQQSNKQRRNSSTNNSRKSNRSKRQKQKAREQRKRYRRQQKQYTDRENNANATAGGTRYTGPGPAPPWKTGNVPGFSIRIDGHSTFAVPELYLFIPGIILFILADIGYGLVAAESVASSTPPTLLLIPLLTLFVFIPGQLSETPDNSLPLFTVPLVALAGAFYLGVESPFGALALYYGYTTLVSRVTGTMHLLNATETQKWWVMAGVMGIPICYVASDALSAMFPNNVAVGYVFSVLEYPQIPAFEAGPILLIPFGIAVGMAILIETDTAPNELWE